MPTLNVEGVGKIKIPDDVPPEAYDSIVKDAVSKKRVSFDRPKAETDKSRAAGEESLKSAKETMTGALPAAGALGFVAASGGLGALGVAGMAGLGGGLGESVKQITNRLMGLDTPKTSKEAALDIGKSGATQAGFELGGAAVTGLAKKVVNLPWQKLVGMASTPESKAVTGIAEKMGIPLTIPEATGSTPLKMIQNVADRSLMGRGQAFIRKKEQYDSVVKAVNESLDAVAPQTSPMATGVKMKNAFTAMDDALDREADQLYRKADALIPKDTPVDLKLSQRITRSDVAKSAPAAKEFPGVSSHTAPYEKISSDFSRKESEVAGIDISKFPPAAQKQIRETLGQINSGTASWQATRKMLSDLKAFSREREAPRDAVTLAKKLIPAVQRSMQKAARNIAPEAEAAILNADKFYREGRELTKDTVISVLKDKDPSKLAAAIRGPEDVADVRRAIVDVAKDQGAWKSFQRQRLQTYLADAGGSGELALHKIGDNLRKAGKEQLEEEFGKDAVGRKTLQNLTDLSDVVGRVDHLMHAPTRAGAIPSLHEYGDVNRVVNMTAGAVAFASGIGAIKRVGREAAGLFAAPLVNRVLANPRLARKLIDGIDLLPTQYGAGITQIERVMEIGLREAYGVSEMASAHKKIEAEKK